MADENTVPSDSESNLIPVMTGLRVRDEEPPVQPMAVDPPNDLNNENDLDNMLRLQQEDQEREKNNMEQLIQQVVQVELQPDVEVEREVSSYTFVVLADYEIGMDRYTHQGSEVRWVYVNRNTMAATVQIILNFLEDPLPKGIIVHCLNRFWQELGGSVNDAMQAMRKIADKMKSVFTHNLVFSTSLFRPYLEKIWPKIAQFNLFTRAINIQMKKTPLGVHKCLLRRTKNLKALASKGDMWAEFCNNSGVGKNLSPAGISKVCIWFGNHFLNGMQTAVDHDTPLTVTENEPACLTLTPGYKGDIMVKFIMELGTYKPPRYNVKTKAWKRWDRQRSKDLKKDHLRPNLSSIGRRVSTSTSSSSTSWSSRRSGTSATPHQDGDLADHVRILQLEKDNLDLQNVVQSLKDSKEDDRKERRRGEESLTATITRLFGEMEWMSRDRTELASKLIKAEQDLLQMKEDRDHFSDQLDKKRKEK